MTAPRSQPYTISKLQETCSALHLTWSCHQRCYQTVLNTAGSVFYGIYYASFYTQYLQLLAAYSLAEPTSEEVLTGQASSFQGALAASGRLEVPYANTAISALIEPPCSGAICQQSIYALAPDTAFQVGLVSTLPRSVPPCQPGCV